MKNFKYILVSFFVIAILIPQLALASWWNPLSWFNNWSFNKAEPALQQLDEFKKQQPTSTTTKTPTKSTPKTSVVTKVEVSSGSSWKAIEDYLLPIADGQGLSSFRTINNVEERYYSKEAGKWVWRSTGNATVGLFGGSNSLMGDGADSIVCNLKTWTFCPAGQDLKKNLLLSLSFLFLKYFHLISHPARQIFSCVQ